MGNMDYTLSNIVILMTEIIYHKKNVFLIFFFFFTYAKKTKINKLINFPPLCDCLFNLFINKK